MSTDSSISPVSPCGSCHDWKEGRLSRVRPGSGEPDPISVLVHAQFRALLLSEAYTCLGGTSAVRRGQYRFGLYPELASGGAVSACAGDLADFAREFPADEHPVAVFVAAFDGPLSMDEAEFEIKLWNQLAGLHDCDRQRADWTAEPPDDWDKDDIGFVFADRHFFVVGLHAAASRWARRFGWPTLVFNALSHEKPIRAVGQFERMQERIRDRDRDLQGSVSPTIGLCQTAQFSGRNVTAEWRCPADLE